MKKIILASQSKQRQTILQGLGLEFTAVPSDLDESQVRDADPLQQAMAIAAAKAAVVAEQFPHDIIIAADTFVECQGQILEKPKTTEEAKEMLRLLSGSAAREINGVCYLDPELGINELSNVVVAFSFRTLTEAEIERFVTSQPVMTWSAAFSPAYPDGGAAFVAKLNGSLTGFTHGLPIEWLTPLLQKSGVWK